MSSQASCLLLEFFPWTFRCCRCPTLTFAHVQKGRASKRGARLCLAPTTLLFSLLLICTAFVFFLWESLWQGICKSPLAAQIQELAAGAFVRNHFQVLGDALVFLWELELLIYVCTKQSEKRPKDSAVGEWGWHLAGTKNSNVSAHSAAQAGGGKRGRAFSCFIHFQEGWKETQKKAV